MLIESIRRSRARSLAAAGAPEAENQFQDLFESSVRPGDIAYDAARSYHLSGNLERALHWYRAGMGPGSDGLRGRPMTEHLEGTVLALVELKSYEDARAEIRRFVLTYPILAQQGATLSKYVRWREGAVPDADDTEINYASSDLHRYWRLEFLLRRGEPAEALIESIDRELVATSEALPMLLALKAELLDRTSARSEANALVKRAREEAVTQRARLVGVRASFDLIETRNRRIADSPES